MNSTASFVPQTFLIGTTCFRSAPLVASQASIGFMHLELNRKDARLNSKMTPVTFLAVFFVVGDAILE